MKFGAHVSSAGGVQKAPGNAAEIGAECFQFFSRSPQGGPAPVLTPEIVDEFLAACKAHKMSEWVIHTPYYINFASGEERIRKNSTRIVREELERGTLLNAAYVMFHPGSAKDTGREKGMKHCIDGISRVLDKYKGTTKLLIEISAGAGEVMGDTFEELAEMIEGVGNPELGICFDTQHAFASGYDLRDAKTLTTMMKKFDETVGWERLKMSHCNDSKVELSGHKDRHEHLGKGFIGSDGFKAIVASKKWAKINLYCETEHDAVKADIALLKKYRSA